MEDHSAECGAALLLGAELAKVQIVGLVHNTFQAVELKRDTKERQIA